MTTGYGISHKDTKHIDKFNNRTKATEKQHNETTDFFQNTLKITQKRV